MIKFLIFLSITILIFTGCKQPRPISKSAVVTFIAGGIKVHDTAFVTLKGSEVGIEVYSAGNIVLDITATSMVCINSSCLSDDEFSSKYLSEYYPPRIINKIISKKQLKIKDIKTEINKDGFIQSVFDKDKYDIKYIVKKDEVFFKDRKNRVIIKIKDLN